MTPEEVADFFCLLAYRVKRGSRPIVRVWMQLSVEEIRKLWAGRRDLMTMSKLPNNSDQRTDAILTSHRVVDELLSQCMDGDKHKTDPSIVMDRLEINEIANAATFLVEFAILKEAEKAKDAYAAKQNWAKGRKGYQ